jgi:hypothetical protein
MVLSQSLYHRFVKNIIQPMRGFKATAIFSRFERMRN